MTYRIVRMRFNKPNKVIKRGLTLEEAQEHCRREDTHGPGWFDGYEEEQGNDTWVDSWGRIHGLSIVGSHVSFINGSIGNADNQKGMD